MIRHWNDQGDQQIVRDGDPFNRLSDFPRIFIARPEMYGSRGAPIIRNIGGADNVHDLFIPRNWLFL